AKPGFCRLASVDGFILVFMKVRGAVFGVGQFIFVEDGIADDILFARPSAEIQQAAPFTAERKVGVAFRIRRRFADRAVMLHGASLSQNAQRRSGGDAVKSLGGGLRDFLWTSCRAR